MLPKVEGQGLEKKTDTVSDDAGWGYIYYPLVILLGFRYDAGLVFYIPFNIILVISR